MAIRRRTCDACLALCLLTVVGCATTSAPQGWLVSPLEVQKDSYGGWVEIQYFDSSSRPGELTGELIAISGDSLFVADHKLHAVARPSVKQARLTIYKSHAGGMAALVLAGTLLTITNGYYLLITAPLWLVVGSIATVSRSYQPILDYPEHPLSEFSSYSRYPQGLPTNIDRTQVRMKPLAR